MKNHTSKWGRLATASIVLAALMFLSVSFRGQATVVEAAPQTQATECPTAYEGDEICETPTTGQVSPCPTTYEGDEICETPTNTPTETATNTTVPPSNTATNTTVPPSNTATNTTVPPGQQTVPSPTPTNTAVPPVNTATTPPVATQQATVIAAAPTPEIQTETVPLLPVTGQAAGVAALVLLSLGLLGLGIMLRRTHRRSF